MKTRFRCRCPQTNSIRLRIHVKGCRIYGDIPRDDQVTVEPIT